ncbi:unnamed protein product [Urochloa humidicola]
MIKFLGRNCKETVATLLTALLASRNAESVNTVGSHIHQERERESKSSSRFSSTNTATALAPQGGSSTSENPSVSSSAPDISGASGVAHSAELVSQLPSSTNHDEVIEINGKKGEGSKSDSGDRTIEKLDSASTEVKCICLLDQGVQTWVVLQIQKKTTLDHH